MSFNQFNNPSTSGGKLVQEYIQHIHSQNIGPTALNTPLFLTKHGITHTKKLVTMLDGLLDISNHKFSGDKVLFDFLQRSVETTYNYNVDPVSGVGNIIKPITSYDLPLGYQKLQFKSTDSGVYTFISRTSSDTYIGSALSLRARLTSHMASFNGYTPTELHT